MYEKIDFLCRDSVNSMTRDNIENTILRIKQSKVDIIEAIRETLKQRMSEKQLIEYINSEFSYLTSTVETM